MRKKLSREEGLTLVELLAAVVILILLGLMLNTGLVMAARTYRAITAQSEVELLLSTAVNALADDLRYAQNVSGSGAGFTYSSDSYGENTSLTLDGKGQIMANGKRVLPTGAYGGGGAYRVTELTVTSDNSNESDEVTFTIKLKVETVGGTISAETPEDGVIIRCLNPPNEAAETPPEGGTP